MIAHLGDRVFHKTLQEIYEVVATAPGEVCVERTYNGVTKLVWFPESELKAA